MNKLDTHLKLLAIVSLIALFGTGCRSDVCKDTLSTKGRHFVVTVPPIVSDSIFNLSISIAGLNSGYATVRQYDGSNSTQLGNYTLSSGVAEIRYFPGRSIRQRNVGVQTKALEISASVDVTVHITGYVGNVAASFIAWPVELLSNEYSIPSYTTAYGSEYNYVQITSMQNTSYITVNNYTSPTSKSNATISKWMSYTLKTAKDPNQAYVVSNNPINVVVGSMCTIVKNNFNCDTLYDSPIPVKYWGTAFVIPPLVPKSGYAIRIYSKFGNSTGANVEYLYGNTHKKLRVQGMEEISMGTEPTVLLSDEPINVIQYGFTENGDAGDSFMTSVPAVKHYSKDYVFGTPFSDKNFIFRLTITIGQGLYGDLLLDNRNITEYPFVGKWSPNSLFNNFDIITLKVKPGSHVLRHKNSNVKFAAMLYGLKDLFGFGHSLGFSVPQNKNSTCYNGGSCMPDGRCVCIYGYTGKHCEHNLDICASRPCLNGGICKSDNVYWRCTCDSGWTGKYCESALVAPTTSTATNTTTNTGVNTTSNTLTCFDCDYTTSPSFCDSIQSCGQHQRCFLKKTNGTNGHVHFSSGCADEQVCYNNEHVHSHTSTDVCLQCCNDNFCNSRGCGDIGFPPKETRGPICLDCSYASDPKACDKVTICGTDELCHIEKLPWGSNTIYHLGCKPQNECALWANHGNQADRTLRSTPICKTCCQGDFCNQNCTMHDSSPQIIVG